MSIPCILAQTVHNARTNADGTITTQSRTSLSSNVNITTHSAENFHLIFGVSRETEICEIIVLLDGNKL